MGRCSTSRLSINSSIMPGLLVRMPARYGQAAHSRTYRFERRVVEAEQLPQRRLAAERIAHAAEVHQRRIGLGRLGDRRQQPRRDRRQKVPAAARRKEANLLGRQAPSGFDTRPARRRTDSGRALAGSARCGGSGSFTRSTSGSAAPSSGKASCSKWFEHLAILPRAAGVVVVKRLQAACGAAYRCSPCGPRACPARFDRRAACASADRT